MLEIMCLGISCLMDLLGGKKCVAIIIGLGMSSNCDPALDNTGIGWPRE